MGRWKYFKRDPVRHSRKPVKIACPGCTPDELAAWQVSFRVFGGSKPFSVSLNFVVARIGRAVIEFEFKQGADPTGPVAAVLRRG